MATTYALIDPFGNPIVQSAVDTGVATAPFDRPSIFTPPGGAYPVITTANDYSVGSTPTPRRDTFEPPSVMVTVDPGLAASG